MKYYNQLKSVPEEMTKKITGGRLNGMTDIKPQWRYMRFSEVFGDCGIGWYYNIKKMWTENGSDGQVVAFAEIELFFKDGDVWSKPIAGIGGSTLIAKESKGMFTNDECYKMAVTDALSVAMKMVGVGADIYMGYPPQTKYTKEEPKTTQEAETDPTDTKTAGRTITDSDIKKARELAGLKPQWIIETVKEQFSKTYKELTNIEKASLLKLIEKELNK